MAMQLPRRTRSDSCWSPATLDCPAAIAVLFGEGTGVAIGRIGAEWLAFMSSLTFIIAFGRTIGSCGTTGPDELLLASLERPECGGAEPRSPCQAVAFSRYSLPARQTCCHDSRETFSNHRDTSTMLLAAGIVPLLLRTRGGSSSCRGVGITEELMSEVSRVGSFSMESPSAGKEGGSPGSGCLTTSALKARTPRVKADDSRTG